MGDGVRVLTRWMKKATEIAGKAGTQLRDRTRSVQRRLIEIGRASRSKGKGGMEKRKAVYRKLVETTSGVVGQAKKFSVEPSPGNIPLLPVRSRQTCGLPCTTRPFPKIDFCAGR